MPSQAYSSHGEECTSSNRTGSSCVPQNSSIGQNTPSSESPLHGGLCTAHLGQPTPSQHQKHPEPRGKGLVGWAWHTAGLWESQQPVPTPLSAEALDELCSMLAAGTDLCVLLQLWLLSAGKFPTAANPEAPRTDFKSVLYPESSEIHRPLSARSCTSPSAIPPGSPTLAQQSKQCHFQMPLGPAIVKVTNSALKQIPLPSLQH